MASASIRDEQQGEEPTPMESQPEPLNVIEELYVPEAGLQRTVIEVVRVDLEASKTERGKRKYGYTAKGEELSYHEWLKQLKELYSGQREPKTVPWQFCSNRSMMIAMAILEVLHARIFPAVYNEELTRWRPTRAVDTETAERIEVFMFWWIRVWVKMREFFDRWTRTALGFGRVVTYTHWDVQQIDKGERTEEQQQVNPDGTVSITPPQKQLETIEKSCSEVIPDEDIYLMPGAADIQRDTVIIRKTYLYRDLVDLERQGLIVNITKPSAEGIVPLKDLMPQPAIGATQVSMDPEELERLKDVHRRNVPIDCYDWWSSYDIDEDGQPEQVRALVNLQYNIYFGALPLTALSKRGMRPLDLTMYMPRLDDPLGLHGLGVLEQVKEHALEIDAIFNQLTDANSLSIMRPGFFDPGGDIDAPAIRLAPNKMTGISNPTQSVFFPQIDIPTERLINAIKVVLEFIERLTAASSYIMGKESEIVGGSGTATRTNAIVTASNQRHAVPVQRLREGAARIMTQHLDQVQTHLPPGFEQRVLNDGGDPLFTDANPLTTESLSGEFDAYLLPDESMGSKESERQLAQLLYSVALTNPLFMSDPAKVYKVTADLLKSYGKDPVTYLGPEVPIAQARTPQDEHALMLSGMFGQVKVSLLDNHLEHLMSHQAAPQTMEFQLLQPMDQQLVLQFLQQHMQEHMQMMQMILQQSAQQSKGAQNGSGSKGSSPRGTRSAQPVGPEPSVGSPVNPLAQAGAVQRSGESQPVA